MKWFGESWGAPVCGYTEHVATPVGEMCLSCGVKILPGDAGFSVPSLTDAVFAAVGPVKTWRERPYHRKCFLELVLGEDKAHEIEEGAKR